jgi:cytochrome c oxidase subunit 2
MLNWSKTLGCSAPSLAALLVMTVAGSAEAGMGQPTSRQMGMQDPASDVARQIYWFHDYTNIFIVVIAVIVLILLGLVMLKFNERTNPNPSRTTHNTALEVVWTVVPILILVAIAVPSFKLLYLQYSYPKPDVTIKAIGNAWFWEHEYPDNGNIRVTSNMLKDEDVLATKHGKAYLKKFEKMDELAKLRAMYDEAKPLWDEQKLVRQLSVDNEIAVPVGKVVHVLVTSNDVIHAWTIPSFGSKTQAVPGRITSTWFKADKVGIFYGQCSVLCGKQHSGMPIAVRVVQQAAYDQWLAAAKAKDWKKARSILLAATDEAGGTKVAAAESGSKQ